MKKIVLVIILAFFFSALCFVYAENLSVSANAAIAVDSNNNIILYEKNLTKKIYPASTTKILTAILALENLNLNDSVVVSKTAISIPWDSSSIYLKQGEVVTIEELLYGLLLDSGNDAANVLGEAIGGDLKTFVNMMNEKAIEIGCTNTHFNNAHGYSDDNHYTTALDMVKIFNYCINNEKFVEIISTKMYVMNETNKTKEKRYFVNTNRLIQTKEDSAYGRYYEYCIGGKTGYTDEAGRCLICFGKKDDKVVTIGIFGASTEGTKDQRYTDAISLFEYVFDNFEKSIIAKPEDFHYTYINIENKLKYNISLKDNVEILSKSPDDIIALTYDIFVDDNSLKDINIESEIPQTIIGNILFTLTLKDNNEYTIIEPLYLDSVNEYIPEVSYNITIIALIIIILIVIITIFILIKCMKKKEVIQNNSRRSRRGL